MIFLMSVHETGDGFNNSWEVYSGCIEGREIEVDTSKLLSRATLVVAFFRQT